MNLSFILLLLALVLCVFCENPVPNKFVDTTTCTYNVWCNQNNGGFTTNDWAVGDIITWGLKLSPPGCYNCRSINFTAQVVSLPAPGTVYRISYLHQTSPYQLPASFNTTANYQSPYGSNGVQQNVSYAAESGTVFGSSVIERWSFGIQGLDLSTLNFLEFAHVSQVAPTTPDRIIHYQGPAGIDRGGKRSNNKRSSSGSYISPAAGNTGSFQGSSGYASCPSSGSCWEPPENQPTVAASASETWYLNDGPLTGKRNAPFYTRRLSFSAGVISSGNAILAAVDSNGASVHGGIAIGF